ncbi:MAG: peptidyl-prolyl cis-trans isomerase [Rickettsiales bacterium]|nr:peptidyl-prolyl cis-trans isomerase [Rickettsiales bacterium]
MRNYSKRRKARITIILIAIFSIFSIATSSYFVNKIPQSEIIAEVNGYKILKSDLQNKIIEALGKEFINFKNNHTYEQINFDKLPKELVESLVKEIYLENEFIKEAKKSNISKNRDVKLEIEKETNKIIKDSFIKNTIKNEANEQKVNQKYLDLSREFEGKKEYKIIESTFETKEQAEEIYKKISDKSINENSTTEILQHYNSKKPEKQNDSTNKTQNNENIEIIKLFYNGNEGYIIEDKIKIEILKILITMKPNEISEPILTSKGWHIIKLLDSRSVKIPHIEQIKEKIKIELATEAIAKINRRILENTNTILFINFRQTNEILKQKKNKTEILEKSKDEKNENQTLNKENINKKEVSKKEKIKLLDEKETESSIEDSLTIKEGEENTENSQEKKSRKKVVDKKIDEEKKPEKDEKLPEKNNEKKTNQNKIEQ